MISVHPSAVVSSRARLHDGVTIGPLAVVGDDVELGAGTRLIGQCSVLGPARLGERNTVHPFAVLGGDPQDRSFAGQATRLEVGSDNVFREHVTVHRGSPKDAGVTVIGRGSLFMVGAHVAHDAVIGDHVTLTNATLVGGHAKLDDYVVTGGAAAVAPFVRIGESAFLAAGAMVERDVPPFVIAAGDRAVVRALNRVGLKRRGISDASFAAIERAFRVVFRRNTPRAAALSYVRAELGHDPWVARLLAFLELPARTPAK